MYRRCTTRFGWLLFLLTALGVLPTTGCSGRKIYPVEGKVVFSDGQDAVELAGGTVEFESADTRQCSSGEIQKDGRFRLSTETPGDGAVVGRNRVIVVQWPGDPDKPAPPKVIDPRYKRYESSGLEVVVKPGKNQVVLTVERYRKPPAEKR